MEKKDKRVKINEIETKKTAKRTNESKNWFFENTNKIDRPWGQPTKRKNRKPKLINQK